MTLGRNRVCIRILDPANHLDAVCENFDRLALPFGLHNLPGADHRTTRRQTLNLGRIVIQFTWRDDLHSVEAAAVMDLQK